MFEETPDYLIPYNWSLPPDQNRFAKYKQLRNARNSSQATVGCCTIV